MAATAAVADAAAGATNGGRARDGEGHVAGGGRHSCHRTAARAAAACRPAASSPCCLRQGRARSTAARPLTPS